MTNIKNNTKKKKIGAVLGATLVAAAGIAGVSAIDVNDRNIKNNMEDYDEDFNHGDFEDDDFEDYEDYYFDDEDFEDEYYEEDYSELISEMNGPLKDYALNLSNEIEVDEERLETLYEMAEEEFEKYDEEIETLYDGYVEMSDEEFLNSIDKLEDQMKDFDEKYTDIEESLGIENLEKDLDNKYMLLDAVIEKHFHEDEEEYENEHDLSELSEEDQQEVEKLYDELDQKYEEHAAEFEELEKKTGIAGLWEKIDSFFK